MIGENIAVDFDGTCVVHAYPDIGEDVPFAVEVLKQLQVRNQIFVYTMRSGNTLVEAVQWFKDREIFLSGINTNPGQSVWTSSPKCSADVYIDDAALGAPLTRMGTKHHNHLVKVVDWQKVAVHLGLPVPGKMKGKRK